MKLLLSTFLFAFSISCYAQFEIEEDAAFLNSNINRVGIGTDGNAGSPSARLNVRSSNNTDNGGLISILSTLESEGKFGIVSKVAEADDKAFAVFLSNKEDENQTGETFVVKGDGMVYATEIKVQLPPFPDYVFAEGYDLMSINELKAFIKKEGHLPNIPSAKEIDKSGIGLGELSVLNTEKIEELTQYIIQLQGQIDALQQQVTDYQSKK